MKTISIITALLGAAAVAGGAFGAHALRNVLTLHEMDIYTKGIQYQFIHVLAAMGVIALYTVKPYKILRDIAFMFITGIILFSGSLYLLTWMEYTDTVIPKPIALLTPLGGLCFIIGWLMLGFHFVRYTFNTKS